MKKIDQKKVALIHVAKAQVGMAEEEYRDLLGSVGVESSKDLTAKTFKVVMDAFKKLGFVSRSKRKLRREVENLPVGRREIMKKLEAILADMDLPWSYVDSIAQKRFGVGTVQWLDLEDLRSVMQMMIYHQKRRAKWDCPDTLWKIGRNEWAVCLRPRQFNPLLKVLWWCSGENGWPRLRYIIPGCNTLIL